MAKARPGYPERAFIMKRPGAAGKPGSVLVRGSLRGTDPVKRLRPGATISLPDAVADAGRAETLSTLPAPLRTGASGLHGLARDGVYRAPAVTDRAVRSYRTLSPLPVPGEPGHRRFAFCGTVPRGRAARPGWA